MCTKLPAESTWALVVLPFLGLGPVTCRVPPKIIGHPGSRTRSCWQRPTAKTNAHPRNTLQVLKGNAAVSIHKPVKFPSNVIL